MADLSLAQGAEQFSCLNLFHVSFRHIKIKREMSGLTFQGLERSEILSFKH